MKPRLYVEEVAQDTARYPIARGFELTLLPLHYVTPCRCRGKTVRADCEAILESDRCARIHPVAIKSEDQQALVALHRVGSQWVALDRSSHDPQQNGMRGLLPGVRDAPLYFARPS
jgi:transposase